LPGKIQTLVNPDDIVTPTGKQLFSNINNFFTSDPVVQKMKSMSAAEFTSDLINNQLTPGIGKQFAPAFDSVNKFLQENPKWKDLSASEFTADFIETVVKPKLGEAADTGAKVAADYSDTLVSDTLSFCPNLNCHEPAYKHDDTDRT
jgi:hypothetical protein